MVEDTRCSEQGRCQVGGEAARKIKRGQKIEKQGQKIGKLAQKIGCYRDKKVGWTTRKG